jgi:DNA-binding transcriptional regulator YiaG
MNSFIGVYKAFIIASFISFAIQKSGKKVIMNKYSDIASVIKALRKRTGLTQEKFAAKLGVTFPTINRWENGRSKPSPLAMERIEILLKSMLDDGDKWMRQFISSKEEKQL